MAFLHRRRHHPICRPSGLLLVSTLLFPQQRGGTPSNEPVIPSNEPVIPSNEPVIPSNEPVIPSNDPVNHSSLLFDEAIAILTHAENDYDA